MVPRLSQCPSSSTLRARVLAQPLDVAREHVARVGCRARRCRSRSGRPAGCRPPPGRGPLRARSRLEPAEPLLAEAAARASLPSPAFGPFFLQPPASGDHQHEREDEPRFHQPLIHRTLPAVDASAIPGAATTRATYHRPSRGSIVSASRPSRSASTRCAPPAARRREDEVAAVGRPRRILVAALRRDRARARAVGAGDDDLEAAAGARRLGEAIALRRPRRRGVVVAGPRHARDAASRRASIT